MTEPSFVFSGEAYDAASSTQERQGEALLRHLHVKKGDRVLDIGCGNGVTTLALYQKEPGVTVDAFDLSDSMIEQAKRHQKDRGYQDETVRFFVMDAMKLSQKETYDIVVSNAALHWVPDLQRMYQKMYDALKKGGRLALQQGGAGCYRGLHEIVHRAISELGMENYFEGFQYPANYLRSKELVDILWGAGFSDIVVQGVETDGRELPTLLEDFANAGMLPYLAQLPDNAAVEALQKRYQKLCQGGGVDTYTHRLYAFASK